MLRFGGVIITKLRHRFGKRKLLGFLFRLQADFPLPYDSSSSRCTSELNSGIKKEEIILSKRKADEGMVSGYPPIKPQLFKKGKLFFEYKREPGSDSYTMEYNPEFNKRMISDYPVMIVKLFREGRLVYEQENQIGSATHIIEYNHKFTGLYESLDIYVKQTPIMEEYESLRRSAKE